MKHDNPTFLQPQSDPQSLVQLQKIVLRSTFGAGGNKVITDSKKLLLITHPH